jgi:hypothetical protein
MRKPTLLSLLLGHALTLPSLAALSGCQATTVHAPTYSASILPLKSVRLYETGVGYFERAGSIGARDTALPVPAGHLDDALKTLVLLSQDKGTRVYGVEFASSVSKGMGRALAGLPLGSDEPLSYRDLLLSLKGAAIEVRLPESQVRGRLIDALPAAAPAAPDKADKPVAGVAAATGELMLLLLTDGGELLRLHSSHVVAVRPLDPSFARRLQTALDATSQRSARAQRLLRLLSRDSGPVTIGYIAETPLWRVSYRLVLDAAGKSGVLQGWALLHNDTDEDWRRVQIHLVNGQPDSFLFPLAAPRYTRRPLVTPDNELSTMPQLLGTNADTLWGEHIEDSYGAGGLGLTGTGAGGGGTGEGTIGLGSIGTIGHGSGTGTSGASSLLQVGNLAAVAQSTGVESAAQFTYSLSDPLDLRAHGSALVPFAQEAVEIEAITWLASPGSQARSGVRLHNTTRQTLPAGTLAVFADGGLAGETTLSRLKPGEKRFMQYGVDLDVEVKALKTQRKDEPQRVLYEDGTVEEHYLRRSDSLYRIENRSGLARTLHMPMHVQANAQVQGADRLDFDPTAQQAVAIFELAPQSRSERPVSTTEGLVDRMNLGSLSSGWLLGLSNAATIPAAERQVLTEAAARQKEIEDAAKELDKTHAEVKKTEKELERLREHLKAMAHDPSAGAAQSPLVKRVLDGEDRLSAQQKKIETLEAEQDKRREVVRKVLERLPRRPK